MGRPFCGTFARPMSATRQETEILPIPRLRRIGSIARLSIATLLCSLVLLLGATPGATANEARHTAQQGEVDQAETELLRQLEQAQRLEAEALQREADEREARAERLARERQAVTDRNAAEREARQERLRRQIESELDLQDEMLERKQRNETTSSRDLLGAHALAGLASQDARSTARMAPEAPEIRDLPRSIFSSESVTIPAGTLGFENSRKLKLTRLVLDADGDGVPEVVRYVDRKTDAWIRQEEDRNYDGTMDAFYRFEGGQLVVRELDGNDDGRSEIRERYAGRRMVARTLDRDDDGVVDAFYDYEGPYLARERHDADNDGEIDLLIQYREGRRVKSEEDTDRDGRVDTWIHYALVDGLETVSQIESDKTGRGFADTYETFEAHQGKAILARREEDLDGDGAIDLISIYRAGKLVRREILKPEVVPL